MSEIEKVLLSFIILQFIFNIFIFGSLLNEKLKIREAFLMINNLKRKVFLKDDWK